MAHRFKNTRRGEKTDPHSLFLLVESGSSPRVYEVTINPVKGHWCDCRGNLSKQRAASRRGEKRDPHKPAHWCKHVNEALKDGQAIADAAVQSKKAA